ncbi:delta and Notch-like epidermal growth factor-related receptor [Dreissena polymorpha]|nr:delta and Notch-like epidermal growth factor-related receptor [Dreissena polymorpha]
MIYNATDDLDSPGACASPVENAPFLESDNNTLLMLPRHLHFLESSITVLAEFAANPPDDATSTRCWKLVFSIHKCPSDNRGLMCSGNGLCLLREGLPQCHCCVGFTGLYCRESTCFEADCQNGGTCLVSKDVTGYEPVCVCPVNTTGSRCEVALNPCWSNPCFHGVCVNNSSGYDCFCVPGYHGPDCRFEFDECASNPCLNDGTCEDMIDAFKCRCYHGYRGSKCEIKVDLCNPNPCAANISCIDLGKNVHCACPSGRTGDKCDHVISACLSSPCNSHATCIEKNGGYKCLCPATFAGKQCEYIMDIFSPPVETSELSDSAHRHNLYIVAGTLGTLVLVVVAVLVACYCRIYETYRQLRWHRLRNHIGRSVSCPDLDMHGSREELYKGARLSVDSALLGNTARLQGNSSRCYENSTFESTGSGAAMSVLQV